MRIITTKLPSAMDVAPWCYKWDGLISGWGYGANNKGIRDAGSTADFRILFEI